MAQDKLRKHILIVDDDPVIQVALPSLLREKFLVDVANNGQQALDLDLQQFDLILMDINMPKLNGIDATKAIRKQEKENERIPIVGMTANALNKIKRKCLKAGMNEVLDKPVLPDDVENLIKRYTDL